MTDDWMAVRPLATMLLMSFELSEISGGTEGHWGEVPAIAIWLMQVCGDLLRPSTASFCHSPSHVFHDIMCRFAGILWGLRLHFVFHHVMSFTMSCLSPCHVFHHVMCRFAGIHRRLRQFWQHCFGPATRKTRINRIQKNSSLSLQVCWTN